MKLPSIIITCSGEGGRKGGREGLFVDLLLFYSHERFRPKLVQHVRRRKLDKHKRVSVKGGRREEKVGISEELFYNHLSFENNEKLFYHLRCHVINSTSILTF